MEQKKRVYKYALILPYRIGYAVVVNYQVQGYVHESVVRMAATLIQSGQIPDILMSASQ